MYNSGIIYNALRFQRIYKINLKIMNYQGIIIIILPRHFIECL